MKKMIKKNSTQKLRKLDIENNFLSYYFKETGDKMNIPIELLNPKNSPKSFLENFAVPKTINN